MSNPQFHQPGAAHEVEHPPHGPRWRRMHHRPFFWVATVCILVAMIIYVVSNGLAFWPGHAAQPPVPALP